VVVEIGGGVLDDVVTVRKELAKQVLDMAQSLWDDWQCVSCVGRWDPEQQRKFMNEAAELAEAVLDMLGGGSK
jgi:hypothetical protein